MMMWYTRAYWTDLTMLSNAIRALGCNMQVHAAGYRENVDSNPLIPLPNDEAVVQTALANPESTAAFRRIQTGGCSATARALFP